MVECMMWYEIIEVHKLGLQKIITVSHNFDQKVLCFRRCFVSGRGGRLPHCVHRCHTVPFNQIRLGKTPAAFARVHAVVAVGRLPLVLSRFLE